MIDVRIPKTGDAVEFGTIIEWLVQDGGVVHRDQPIYLLETDKVEMEIDSPADGVLRIVAETGEEYPVGTIIATIEQG
jgi:2-oxoglutarate dehydrogenase E2 component (dihydrolipoamide succinyltransferase)